MMTLSLPGFGSGRIACFTAGVCLIGLIAPGAPVCAADDGSFDATLNEVVVTALRRTQKSQDVPAALTVIGGDRLAADGAQDYKDYLNAVPGVTYSEIGYRGSRAVIRGVSDGFATTDPLTGIYIDEAPITQSESPTFDPSLYDVDRVEVLKGPQGTLYGSGSMGGTIRIIMKKPQMNTFAGAVDGTYGDLAHGGDLYRVDGVLNTPVVTDFAAFRLVGSYRNQDGFIDNVNPAKAQTGINTVKKENVRAQLLLTPQSGTSILLSFMYQNEKLGGSPYADLSLPQYEQSRAYRESGPNDSTLSSITIQHEFAAATLVSATNYLTHDDRQNVDATNSFRSIIGLLTGVPVGPSDGLGVRTLEKFKVFSQEVRLASRDDQPLQWLAGLFYSDQRSDSTQVFDPSQAPAVAAQFGGAEIFQDVPQNYTRQLAAFGELTYNFTQRLSATAGIRGFDIRQHDVDNTDGILNGGPSGTDLHAKSRSETQKYLLDYKLTADNLVYAQAVQGFRAGGPNTAIPLSLCGADLAALGYASAPTQYQPDKLWNYEIGSKNTLLDRRLTLNGAMYYIDWNKIQSTINLPTCFVGFTTNAGKAVSKGVELEASFEPFQRWTVSASMAYTDAKLTSPAAGTGLSAGDELPLVSKLSWNVSSEYGFPLVAGLDGFARAEVSRVGNRWDEFESASAYSRLMPAYVVTNVRLGLTGAHWSAAVYATNLFDSYIVNYESASTTPYNVLGLPRVIGVNARYSF